LLLKASHFSLDFLETVRAKERQTDTLDRVGYGLRGKWEVGLGGASSTGLQPNLPPLKVPGGF
jgi:hypothetical protein